MIVGMIMASEKLILSQVIVGLVLVKAGKVPVKF